MAELTINNLIKGIIFGVVLVVVILGTTSLHGKQIKFFDWIPSFGNQSVEKVDVDMILRYDLIDGDVMYYDGTEWVWFEGKSVGVGGSELKYGDVKGDFEKYYWGGEREEIIAVGIANVRVKEFNRAYLRFDWSSLGLNAIDQLLMGDGSFKVFDNYDVINPDLSELKLNVVGESDNFLRIKKTYPQRYLSDSLHMMMVHYMDELDGLLYGSLKFEERDYGMGNSIGDKDEVYYYPVLYKGEPTGIFLGEIYKTDIRQRDVISFKLYYNAPKFKDWSLGERKVLKDALIDWKNSVFEKPIAIGGKHYCLREFRDGKYIIVDLGVGVVDEGVKCEVKIR